MSIVEKDQINEVLDRVSTWSTAGRIALARRILESLEAQPLSEPPRTRSLKDLVGLLKTDAPPPTDEECRKILEEELMKKYGK
jgi:hypothetical protein